MCGIVGVLYKNDLVSKELISKGVNCLKSRGPDDVGIWVENNIGLGHRRLAILDTTIAGHQPMFSSDERYVIVYNGEVYNFSDLKKNTVFQTCKWKSNSDTEVILEAFARWGPQCVEYFQGMFSLVIWDRLEQTLFAARDRMGVKPFYFYNGPDLFAFASRPKALIAMYPYLLNEIDRQAMRLYLECGYIPAPYSFYRNINKLQPAHYLLFDSKGLFFKRYWDFRNIVPESSWEKRNEEDLLDELDEIITKSIYSRMISDVPFGAFLSGGIDSSLIVAIMKQYLSTPVKTFTIGFSEEDYDESKYALEVAKYLDTDHYCECLDVNELIKLMPIYLKEFDEPFFDSSAFPMMAVSRLARKIVPVCVSGDGGDELFGGYHYYNIIGRINPLFNLSQSLRNLIAMPIGMIPKHNLKLLAGAIKQTGIVTAFAFMRSIVKDFKNILKEDIICETYGIHEYFTKTAALFYNKLSPEEQGMRLDTFCTLPDDYLQKVDIASMSFSVESREPLLDHKLVEWAMKLPLSWKLRNGLNKYLLRKLAYRYVPQKILDRPKHGFSVPIGDWLRKPLKGWAEERLFNPELFQKLGLDQDRVIELWKIHNSKSRDVHPLIWAILILLEHCLKMTMTEPGPTNLSSLHNINNLKANLRY